MLASRGPADPPSPPCLLRMEITLYECLFPTVLLACFLEYQCQSQCSQPVWLRSLMDGLPSCFSVYVKFICASAAHHTIVLMPGGESLELSGWK